MITAPTSNTDKQRLAELYHYDILDTPPEKSFDEIVQLAAQVCRTKMCAVSFMDEHRQWLKASIGIMYKEMAAEYSFCSHTIHCNSIMEVPNATEDIRFHNNPLVTGEQTIKFYAGVPLINQRGYTVGTLCVFDTKAKSLSKHQKNALKILARQVINLLELQVKNKELAVASDIQKKIISAMEEDIKNPLRSLKYMLQMQQENMLEPTELKGMEEVFAKSLDKTISRLDNLAEWSNAQVKNKNPSVILTNVKSLADECIAQANDSTGIKQNIIINNIDATLNLYIDKHAMKFILRNLIANANTYTQRGVIALYQYSHDNQFYFTVQDTGAGIEMNKINFMLDEANQYAGRGTYNVQSDGLGLRLIRDYLRSTGNELNITSAPGKGTAVSFSIKAVA